MRNAVQFGAGKIGRGFLGQLLYEGGYRTTFVDADTALVDALTARGQYPLRLVSDAQTQTLQIGNLRALDARRDESAVTQVVTEADLLSVAVGANVLPQVVPALAAGINARAAANAGPIDILLCENQWHAATLIRGLLEPHLPSDAREYFEAQVGLVETVVGRMVPMTTEEQRTEDPLLIVAEPYKELPVARAHLRGELPPLPGLIAAENFEAYEARKLYLHNMSHAALAYLGYARGHEFIWQCVADAAVAAICLMGLTETAQALAHWYGEFTDKSLRSYSDDLLRRFANKALGDTVARVAADPLRKLRLEDRLVGAANLCLKNGNEVQALSQVIAAAMRYSNAADPEAQELQRQRSVVGDEKILETVCGIEPGSPLSYWVMGALRE